MKTKTLAAVLLVSLTLGCTSQQVKEMHTVSYVDINRFMGDWFVAAVIPTFVERNAHNPIETYTLNANGTIDTRFRFNQGAGGPGKELTAIGFIKKGTGNAVWGMQFVWPIKAEYRIIFLDENYQHTIIGRTNRDYLWIMSRQPMIAESVLRELIRFAVAQGYDESKILVTSWQEEMRDAG